MLEASLKFLIMMGWTLVLRSISSFSIYTFYFLQVF